MQLNDQEIGRRCGTTDRNDPGAEYYRSSPMIQPFVGEKTRVGALSYGLGHFGYDIRIGNMIRQPLPRRTKSYIDPLNSDDVERQRFDDVQLGSEDKFPLLPGQFILTGTYEYFMIPTDIVAIVHDKSTLARLGIAVQNTVLEPGWNGYLTMEITNHGVHTIMLSASMPIAQVIFYKGAIPCHAYTGRYQDQEFAAPAKG